MKGARQRVRRTIMRARKQVYRHSSIARHMLRKQPRTEVRSADEVLRPAHHRDDA
ncbi:hypothetical protein [Streptomyces sp. NPDC017964]|uniref:hypothetical protein n=1 Tax=Streptomyces sp. NPDC017964 TaxID=3365022 RepID=UPI0037987BAE